MKQAVRLGALSTANIGVAFLFHWYILVQLGPGIETDALFAGMTIPQVVLAVISGSLMHVLVPILSGESEARLQQDAWGFLALVGGTFGVLAVFLYLTAPWWVPITLPGFDVEETVLTVELTRIQLIGLVFAAINGVQWATYHARQQFVRAELTPLLASAVALTILVWALPRFGVIAAAWVAVLRVGLQTALLAPGMGRPMRPDLKSEAIQQAWNRIKPLLVGTAYYKTDPLIDRFLLSSATTGSLSLYYLAQQLYGAASQVVNKALVAPLVPILSKLHKSGDGESYERTYRRKLLQIGAIGLTGLLALAAIGRELLNLVVGMGNVTESDVYDLWWILIWLGGMFVCGVAGQISSAAFYARGDTQTLVRASVISYTAYVPAKVLAFHFWGVMGLALTTSIYYAANFSIQFVLLRRSSS